MDQLLDDDPKGEKRTQQNGNHKRPAHFDKFPRIHSPYTTHANLLFLLCLWLSENMLADPIHPLLSELQFFGLVLDNLLINRLGVIPLFASFKNTRRSKISLDDPGRFLR